MEFKTFEHLSIRVEERFSLCANFVSYAPLANSDHYVAVKIEKVIYPYQTWNLSMLSDGVYVMSVKLKSGQVISERIVKR
jgi:hypothetical protein